MTLVDEGRRLVEVAAAAGAEVRLFGGVAVWCRSTPATQELLGREYADIDLVGHRSTARGLRDALESAGYLPERTFNAAHGARRLLYHAPDRAFHVDVFLDQFEMSHRLDFGDRVEVEPLTLPAADLLLAKLQIAEINEKDLRDTVMLLLDHKLGDDDGAGELNVAYVTTVCGSDWGLFTTVGDNLDKLTALLPAMGLDEQRTAQVGQRVHELGERLQEASKSRAWKMRARIGRRRRWYEIPEEVHR